MMKKAKKKSFLLINVAEKAILLEREDNTNRFRTVYYISCQNFNNTQVSEILLKKEKKYLRPLLLYLG